MIAAISFFLQVTLLAAAASALPAVQTGRAPTPDGFSGFMLDETTLDATVQALGAADADKTDKLDVSKIGKWLDEKHKEKMFRQLTYKKSPDFSKIELSFLADRLVMIELEFRKEFAPGKLPNLFGVQFAHLSAQSSLPDKPGQYPKLFLPNGFPRTHDMIGISPKTFIYVTCESPDGVAVGRVARTQQISRTLEKK